MSEQSNDVLAAPYAGREGLPALPEVAALTAEVVADAAGIM